MPTSVFSSFYNDSNEDIPQLSPGFRPGSGREDSVGFPTEDRRPSVASANTMSSSGSKSSISRGFHKKLQGFFGEEYPGDSRQNSDSSLTTHPGFATEQSQSARGPRNRTNSVNNTLGSSLNSRPGSPVNSRPRTPQPSSEVTPWEYQDVRVSPCHCLCRKSLERVMRQCISRIPSFPQSTSLLPTVIPPQSSLPPQTFRQALLTV